MGSVLKYWQLVRIGSTGQRKVEEMTIAKTFFHQHLSHFTDQPNVTDAPIQRELLKLRQQAQESGNEHGFTPADLCLRCFISHQIEQVCAQLEAEFGKQHGFTRYDLFPFVLDDNGQPILLNKATTSYRSLASTILQTFDPQRAGLNTWTVRQVRHHPELRTFLLQQGVYLASDWAILNDTRPEQLQRILSEFHCLVPAEIELACHLLRSYHEIYRNDRVQQRQQGILKAKEACAPPTTDQLIRMAQWLQTQTTLTLAPESIMSKLQTLATQLRQYRIHVRGGKIPTEPLDQPINLTIKTEVYAPEPDPAQEVQDEFLKHYREHFLRCLDQAIEQVTDDRVSYLHRKNKPMVEPFLTALKLFHCQGQSMGEIAAKIGLQAQFQVTRLMKLKEFRANIRQRLLKLLLDRVLNLVPMYAESTRLEQLDQQLETILDEEISTLMQQAEAEAAIAKRHPLTSLFSRRLCHYLDFRTPTP